MEKDAEKAKEIDNKAVTGVELRQMIAEAISQARSEGYEEGKKEMDEVVKRAYLEGHEEAEMAGEFRGWNEAIAEAVKVVKEASYGEGTPETEEYSGCYLYDIDIAEKLSALVKK